MAGDKYDFHESTVEDNFTDSRGVTHLGIPTCTITINGNVEPDDEWALFRLTDKGMRAYYEIGCEVAAAILSVTIDDKPAVEEQEPRYKTEKEVAEVWEKLSPEEKPRMLIRSVKPKPK